MKNKKWILNLITILLACSFVTSGCKFFYSTKLKAPRLSVNKVDMTLMWDTNYNASAYEIQMNEVVIDTIENDSDKTQYTYSYSDVIGQFGEFRFRVKCIGSGKYADSDLSDAVTVTVGAASDYLNKNTTSVEYEFDDRYDATNVNVLDNVLSWVAPLQVSNLSGYLVSIYTNTLGIKHYQTTKTNLELTNTMKSGNDILAIKVSCVVGGVNYETKDIYYYNPLDADKYGVYTDKIYIFDGAVYDYYIENWTELQNLYYYAFIYRLESIDFMVKKEFYDTYENTYFDTTMGKADDYIMGSGNTAYFETAGFVAAPTLSKINHSTKEFRLSCKFEDFDLLAAGTNTEPTVEGEQYYSQDTNYTPYYELANYEKRDESYDKFVSDNWYLTTEVGTSEELFWAVSSHVTPEFTDTTSRAYLIYNEAKNVLKTIISDDMSDYEKALSIFDYIMLNTTYDLNTFNNSTQSNPMKLMSYYLEGVFLSSTKIAVCDGYSKAFALMCNMEGINCVRVMGVASGGGHAWNKVEIDGNWYIVDITWTEIYDDTDGLQFEPQYTSAGIPYLTQFDGDEEECSHTYFMVGDSVIKSTHRDFENRFIFGLLEAPKSYNYYINDKININGKSMSRVITKISELQEILRNSLIKDLKGVEIIIDYDLFSTYGGEISEILKEAKAYSFMALEQCTYMGQSSLQYSPTEFEGVIYSYIATVGYVKINYDSENPNKAGLLMIIKPSVTITTDTRKNDFIEFVNDCKVEQLHDVLISVDKINEWIDSSITEDEQKIEALEQYFNSCIGNGTTVNIIRIAPDVTEEVYTQDEEGNWGTKTMTSGSYKFEFTYTN